VFTVAEYVMLERETGIKHEMLAGQVWAIDLLKRRSRGRA